MLNALSIQPDFNFIYFDKSQVASAKTIFQILLGLFQIDLEFQKLQIISCFGFCNAKKMPCRNHFTVFTPFSSIKTISFASNFATW